jgi:hypothetical protein
MRLTDENKAALGQQVALGQAARTLPGHPGWEAFIAWAKAEAAHITEYEIMAVTSFEEMTTLQARLRILRAVSVWPEQAQAEGEEAAGILASDSSSNQVPPTVKGREETES